MVFNNCTYLKHKIKIILTLIYTHKIITTIKIMNLSMFPRSSCIPHCKTLLLFHPGSPIPRQPLTCFLSYVLDCILKIYVDGIIQYVLLFLGFFYSSVIILRFIHVAHINSSFLFIAEWITCFINIPQFGYSFTCW